MKLQNLSVIFVVIAIPVILMVSYYISLQIDTINMQVSYNSKLLDATKEAIDSFEINTVEWNESYSTTADSKRRDIMASINTFTTSFANSIGLAGTTKNDVLSYVPAIAYTLYDGYYIYSPAESKEVIKDENGVAVTMSEALMREKNEEGNNIITGGYAFNQKDAGKLLYECESEDQVGKYNNKYFTFEQSKAKPAQNNYTHILKPFTSYSARYVNDSIDIVVNYTLDNYITIYGTIDRGASNITKSGYLINTETTEKPTPESLSEIVWYEGLSEPQQYYYVYASDNTKVYFDNDNTAFQVSSTNIKTNLTSTTGVKYKKIITENETIYQALNNGSVKKKNEEGEVVTIDILQGNCYTDMNGTQKEGVSYDLKKDYSAINYYEESIKFSEWVKYNLSEKISTNNLQIPDGLDKTEFVTEGLIFKDFEAEDSVFNEHKREVIKQSLISSLNQAITAYSRNSEGEYQLPVLSETDWDQILSNVSIITFVQGVPIGMKYYNNYAIATSTTNNEYINSDGIYLSSSEDAYYHVPYCEKLESDNIIGYRSTDYVLKSYKKDDETKYYYKHQNIANQACYYCLVQRDLYNKSENDKHKKAYNTTLARERYVSHEFK